MLQTILVNSYASPFYSEQFENMDSSEYLNMGIWPHNDCGEGNARWLMINPGTFAECINRKTYSYSVPVHHAVFVNSVIKNSESGLT